VQQGRVNVKIFGERNSATTALKLLIERNSSSRVLPSVAEELDPMFRARMRMLSRLPFGSRLGERYIDSVFRGNAPPFSWKHTATEFADIASLRDCVVVFAVRHPASWLLGLHRRPYHSSTRVPKSFAEFLAVRWKTVERDNLGRRSLRPAELWNMKLASYVSVSARLLDAGIPCRWVLFEDFVRDQASVFGALRGLLRNPTTAVSAITASTKERSKGLGYYRDYYGKKRWLADIDEADRKRIDDSVDWSLAARFGYRRLSELATVRAKSQRRGQARAEAAI
jgi:hypothetical protein